MNEQIEERQQIFQTSKYPLQNLVKIKENNQKAIKNGLKSKEDTYNLITATIFNYFKIDKISTSTLE